MPVVEWTPTKAEKFVLLALREVGKPYILGSEGPPESILKTWDCSELVQHCLALVPIECVSNTPGRRTPVSVFDGAWFQWERSKSLKTVKNGVATVGALLFSQFNTKMPHHIGHVAISLGNGYIVEARGKRYGVTIGPVRSSFSLACIVPELY